MKMKLTHQKQLLSDDAFHERRDIEKQKIFSEFGEDVRENKHLHVYYLLAVTAC